jgi:hypothetical protein
VESASFTLLFPLALFRRVALLAILFSRLHVSSCSYSSCDTSGCTSDRRYKARAVAFTLAGTFLVIVV